MHIRFHDIVPKVSSLAPRNNYPISDRPFDTPILYHFYMIEEIQEEYVFDLSNQDNQTASEFLFSIQILFHSSCQYTTLSVMLLAYFVFVVRTA
jgi:hypothetical protein